MTERSVGWLVGALLVVLAPTAGAQVRFGPPVMLSGGGGANVPTVGRLDGDAHLDLVLAATGHEIVAHLGDGFLGFAGPIASSPVAGGANAASLGDFTCDGVPDLGIARGIDLDAVFLVGDGTGMFAESQVYPTGRERTSGLVFADITDDGIVDAVIGSDQSDRISILAGDCTDRLTEWLVIRGYSSPVPSVGDFDEDGLLDLAFTSRGVPATLVTLLQRPGPTFVESDAHSVPGEEGPVVLGDVNGDGHLDAVVLSRSSSSIRSFLGDGAGAFAVGPVSDTGGPTPFNGELGDLDCDGDLDVAMATGADGVVLVMRGDGTGAFMLDTTLPAEVAVYFALGDFDADGDLDLVAGEQDSTAGALVFPNETPCPCLHRASTTVLAEHDPTALFTSPRQPGDLAITWPALTCRFSTGDRDPGAVGDGEALHFYQVTLDMDTLRLSLDGADVVVTY